MVRTVKGLLKHSSINLNIIKIESIKILAFAVLFYSTESDTEDSDIDAPELL